MKKFMIYLSILMISNIYAQCDDYSQTQCSNDNNCEWVEDIETVTCASLVWDEELCEAAPECTYSCWDAGGYFGWCEPECTGGMTYIDNGYCQEMEILECSEMDEMECGNEDSCDWTENIEWGSCYDLDPIWNVVYYCDDPSTNLDNCYTYTCYGGGYGQWGTCCGGDPYIIANNSYCEETEYQLGDLNQDSIINIQDIIIIINLILNGEFDLVADINLDSTVNVLDVIQLVNIILNN
jgi:hypothetical protein